MSKKQIYKPGKVKGFPEWLPEERMVEQQWLDHIRRTFESYGFTSIETPAVEELNVLLAKGETDKEIYTLTRLQQTEEENSEARLGLHFDQTVPFARYTAQHFNELTFPFKRYQMQKVWRGERPQLGRMREFLQCDIDVINVDNLPLHFDAEIPAIIYEVLSGLDIGRVQIKINNRKILGGLLDYYGADTQEKQAYVFRVIDKMEKLEAAEFEKELKASLEPYNFNERNALGDVKAVLAYQNILAEMNLREQINFISELVVALNATEWLAFEEKYKLQKVHYFGHDFGQGFVELLGVLQNLSHLPDHAVKADLSIVRGLDYYTGTVYETNLLDIPEFTSSVCSGGRYDDLAGSYINKHLPGVGISIGFTRLFDVLRHNGYIKPAAKCPTDVLVALPSEEQRAECMETARALRARGFNVETYHAPQKIQKQIAYADKKGISYVWFPDLGEVKNLATGEQTAAKVESWEK